MQIGREGEGKRQQTRNFDKPHTTIFLMADVFLIKMENKKNINHNTKEVSDAW